MFDVKIDMYVQVEGEEKKIHSEEEKGTLAESPTTLYPETNLLERGCSRRRSLYKDGKYRACRKHYKHSELVLQLQDVFTSLVESRWRITLLVFSLSFLATWFIFGVLWWVVAHEHGDLKGSELYDPSREPCVTMMDDFISCFLFSLETQYSTGYGTRSPTTECPEAIFLLIIQSIFGVLIQSTMAGIVFAKLSRPKARSQHIVFSKKGVICVRDGHLSLMFRVGDVRRSHMVGASLRAWLLCHRVTLEGEVLPHYQHSLKLTVDSGGSDTFLLWPSTVVHKIQEDSPLYHMSSLDLTHARFEIVLVVNGTIEATGQTTEAKSSYLPGDILWGHRFRQMVKYNKASKYDYSVDYGRFDDTYLVDTPLCCARDLSSCTYPTSPS